MKINYDFAQEKNTLPLPATLVNVLGQQIEKDYPGTKIRLYSPYPFPHRIKELEQKGMWSQGDYQKGMDQLERDAYAALEKDPSKPFHRMETVNGRLPYMPSPTGCVPPVSIVIIITRKLPKKVGRKARSAVPSKWSCPWRKQTRACAGGPS